MQKKINKYLSIKLENQKTKIYVNSEEFTQCKNIAINIPTEKLTEIKSIDELIYGDPEKFSNDDLYFSPFDVLSKNMNLTLEEEFWAHYSNLKCWADFDYNTNLLNCTLAFPLLKELSDVGDQTAIQVFKEEIAKRINTGYIPVIKYLILENYINYLNKEELTIASEKIQILDLSDCELIKFPEIIFTAKDLTELCIQNNSIEEIDKDIGNLKRLRILNLSNNEIRSIPNSLEKLSNLIILDLNENNITKIPESIGNLSLLTKLYIGNNKITSLPNSFKCLESLESISLFRNKIKTLPKEIHNLKNLKKLNISSNELESIPREIFQISSLNSLILDSNKIRNFSIPELKSTNLEYLSISNNEINYLPKNIHTLSKLISLSISNNGIISIPENIKKLDKLKSLYISGNKIDDTISIVRDIPSLEILGLDEKQRKDFKKKNIDLKKIHMKVI